MKPKNLSEVKSQDEFLVYLIDNYYHILGEGDDIVGVEVLASNYTLTVSPSLIILSESIVGDCLFADYLKTNRTWVASVQSYKGMIAELRNKPSFEGHPDAKCFVQDYSGFWFKNTKTSYVEPSFGGWTSKEFGWHYIQEGQVIGDWKQTFEKAPEKQNDTRAQDVLATAIQEDFEHVENESHIISYDSSKVIFKLGGTLYISGYTLDNGAVQLDMVAEPVLEVISNQEKVIAKLQKDMEELKTKLERIKQTLY